jgi:hypothetical protein
VTPLHRDVFARPQAEAHEDFEDMLAMVLETELAQ